MNPTEDYKSIICYVGITIDYGNDISPENVPEQQEQQKWNKQQGVKVWKPEGIIWPHKANNVKNYFVYFWNYMKEEVTKMNKLELFLVLSSVDHLNTIITLYLKNALDDPIELGECIIWVGCWL